MIVGMATLIYGLVELGSLVVGATLDPSPSTQ